MAASARDCIFCKIVRREVPASIVRDDSSTLAFMDFRPMNPGHVLVIPKAHAAYVEDLPPEAVGPIPKRRGKSPAPCARAESDARR